MDRNESFWATTVRAGEPRVLEHDVRADIAIVGAGLLGVSAAYQLNQLFPEKRVVVLEAARVANGASGRNGGAVLAMTARATFDAMMGFASKRKMLSEGYLNLWKRTALGLDLYQEIIERHRIDCGYSREGYLSLAASRKDADIMAGYAEAASELGIPVQFLDAQQYRKSVEAEGYFGGLYHPDYGQINPMRYLVGLAGVIKERGVEVYEESPVVKIEEGPQCKVLTPKGKVIADAVVLATNAYTPRLGYFKNRIVPVLNPCAATEQLGREKLDRLGWHATRGFHDSSWGVWYMGVTEDYRMIIGGGDISYFYGGKTSFSSKWLERYRGHFERKLRKLFPEAHDVGIEHVWAGAIDATLDLAPTVSVIGDHQNIFCGLGYTGEGVNLAHLSGKIIADLYAGNPEPWQDLSFVNRKPIRIPPDPIRYAALKSAFALAKLSSR